MGLNGDGICRASNFFQSIPLKKSWLIMSAEPFGPKPNLLDASF